MNASQVAIREEHTPQQPMLYHELANLFPLLEGDAFWALVEDVRANGVREPIVLLDGQILDGRNRYHAAREAGVAYQVADYVGDDPLGYVLSLNLKRRHLSESQRAMVAAKLAKLPPGRPKETAQISAVSQPRAAELLNVSRGSIQNAATVQEHATPTLIAAVEAGEVAVSAAATVAKLPEPMQAEIVQIGPQAVREAAAEVRAGADVEQVRAAVIDAAITGLRGGGSTPASRKNPDYKPNPARDAMGAVVDAADQIAQRLQGVGPTFIIAGFHDAAERERSLAKLRAGRDALSQLLEACGAE